MGQGMIYNNNNGEVMHSVDIIVYQNIGKTQRNFNAVGRGPPIGAPINSY